MKRFLIATCFILLLICPLSVMSAGPENMFVWGDFNYFFSQPHTWPGTQTFDEALTGISTYGISGNITLGSTNTNGRVGALLASSSPIVTLPTLSNVYRVAIIQDTTTTGNDSGVTIFSPTQQIYSGVGSTAVAGSTIFVNSGNTRFNMTLKAMPVTGGTLSWFVYSFNGNTLRRP